MKKIEVSYKKAGLFNRHHTGYIPESWDEITDVQLIAIAELYLHERTQLQAVVVLMDLPLRVVKKFSQVELYHILQELAFITDYRPRNCFIISNIRGLMAPRHKLDGITFAQFIFIENYFEQNLGQVSEESLNLFVAHLYLRQNEAFDHSICTARASQRIITTIPLQTRIAVLINYRLIRQWLSNVYPVIFSNTDTKTVVTSRKNPSNQWIKVYESIVGEDLIHHDEYGKQQLHVVLKYITRKIKENARTKH